ncbi:BtrH N-terminal domain-containing protein [Actinocrispum wychmicini]|uniref:Butirosin biosynthesis protein H-like n=1 Tax=Actinocrispum wychmicini TaxID=1213861 RepID=A0A4R2JB65_9PSEU|nr:BtrH N-terminal domain-containing protein [Actinocrispum wychmicini]TCO55597.1 butirosin biosynthesis protein H-like [Actinocrispum wychmicini]
MTASPSALPVVELWCRDVISCLQATFGSVLRHAGHDPLDVLGLHWEFRHKPGDVRSEEFYYPCATPGDLAASLAPHHPVSSAWHQADELDRPLDALADELSRGRLVIAAVDNFHLPFRPAFGDVHAAHLLVVYGIDEHNVHVSDAMPPDFAGPIPVADFLRSWSSANPTDVQDAFFSDSRIDRRYLTVDVGAEFPTLDRALLAKALDHSLELFHGPSHGDRTGLAGLGEFLDEVLKAAETADSATVRDVYPFGWGMQAQSGLHGELLRTWGLREDVPAVREAGRLVETVAHKWTGLRVCAAHGHPEPEAAAKELARHANALRQAYESAVDGLAEARSAL